MRAPLLAIVILVGGCLSPPETTGDGGGEGDGGGVLRRQPITLHPPATLSADDIPVAIVLDADADLADFALSGGRDIRFVTSEDPESTLPHEIERFDPFTGSLAAWVRVPAVSEGTTLEMRYGDGSDVEQQPALVWEGYAGVWHLGEEPAAAAPQIGDSSSSAISGKVVGDPPASVPGIAGQGIEFDKTGEIDLSDTQGGALDFGSGSFSYEVWVRVDPAAVLGDYDMPWHKGGSSTDYPGYDFELGNADWSANVSDGADTILARFRQDPVTGQWVHLVAVVDFDAVEPELRAYLDGVEVDAVPLGGTTSLPGGFAARIGGSSASASTDFIGVIDEVRVRPGVMSPDWISIQHLALAAPEAFAMVGDAEPVP